MVGRIVTSVKSGLFAGEYTINHRPQLPAEPYGRTIVQFGRRVEKVGVAIRERLLDGDVDIDVESF